MKKLLGAASVALLLTVSYALNITFQSNNIFYFLQSGSPFAKTERDCDAEVCNSIVPREAAYFSAQMYGTSECSDETDCREKCLLDNTCEGYTYHNTYDKANPFPTSSQKYDGQFCSGDEDCRDKCIQDATCEGYSKFAYATYTQYEYGAPHLSYSECAYNQALKIYNPVNVNAQPAWNINTATLTLLSNSVTRGSPDYSASKLSAAQIYLGCHVQKVDLSSPNPKYTVMVSQDPVYGTYSYFTKKIYHFFGHPDYMYNYGIRKYYYYKYGQATVSPPSDKHEASYTKEFNAQKYSYGPLVALGTQMQPLEHASKGRLTGTQQESCFIPTLTDFTVFNTQYLNLPLQVTQNADKPFGAILDLNELKAYYNVESKELFETSIDCSETLICVCQHSMQPGTQIYRTGTNTVDDTFFTSENVNNILINAYSKYSNKDDFVAHPYGSCELQSIIYDYYTERECQMSGGIYLEPHEHIFDLLRHLTYVSPSQIGNDVLKADNEVENIHIIQPLLGSSQTNAYIHERSLQKTFDDPTTSGLTFDEAARLCTDRCHKSTDCSYATVKADLTCALFKKCEGVQDAYSESVKTFKKIGWSAATTSTNGKTHKNHFYSMFPEQFLCHNYKSGVLLHKNIFNSNNADTIFFGSTFTHIHGDVQIWPSQSYIYHENGVWKGTLSPSKKYLKFDSALDTYAAHYMQEDSSVGPKYGFEKYVDQCIYNFTKIECQAFANFNAYLINDLNLRDKGNIIYRSRFDDCPANEIATEAQCMAYREVLNADGDVVDTNNHPQGCSISVDLTGARPSTVFFNVGSGENKQIGDTDDEGSVFQRLCFGNENRMFPKGCFMKDGTVNYNEDTVFTSCSLENKCFCSFAIPIMDIDGGLKEMLTDETCAEVCSSTEKCNYVQHHNELCYGLEQCIIQNEYDFLLRQNWSDVQVSATSARILVNNVPEETFFEECASSCKNDGYIDDFIAIVRGNLLGNATYNIQNTATPTNLTFVGLANSLLDCHYMSGTKTIHYNQATSECFSATTGVTFENSWNKQVKCYCLENQCPTCNSQEPFTDIAWKQIYERKLVLNNVEDSKVVALENRTNFFPLFPYNGRWDCDADVITDIIETTCALEAQKRDILVFAHNDETETCILYNHFVDEAKTEILNHMENAKWCYKKDQLRGNEGFITTYGTCARDVKRVERLKYKNCRAKQIDLVSSNACLSWKTEENIDFVSVDDNENKQYFNIAEAVNDCVLSNFCNYIVQVHAFNETVYELYYAKETHYHFNSTTKTYSEVSTCKGHADCEIKNIVAANEGLPDPNVTQLHCEQYSNQNMITVEDKTKPLGCFKSNNQIYFNLGQQNAFITDSLQSDVNYVQCQKFASDNGYTFSTIAHNDALGSFYGADAYPQKCFIEVSENKVFYNYQTTKEVPCDRNINDGICLYKSRIVRAGELCGGSESAFENMGSYSIQRYPNRYDCGYTYQWVEAQQYRNYADCVANTDYIWVENHNIVNYNHLVFYYRNPNHPYYGQYVNVGTSVSTWLYRDGSKAPNFEYTATNTVQHYRYPKEQNKCINLGYDPVTVECSAATQCIKMHSYTYAIENEEEKCYKSFFTEDCTPSKNSLSLLTLPAYKVFDCEYDKKATLENETDVGSKSMLECQDKCIYSNSCNAIEYDLATKNCKIGTLLNKEEGGNVVCQYDADYQVYQQLVTKQECGEDAFTPHNNPAFSNYKTFMLGNIEYGTAARACEDCPAGQEPFSTTSYDCVQNVKQNHFCVLSNLVNIDTCALKDETGSGQREVTLQTCKEFCDATSCTVLNFEETREDHGHCFLMTNQQKALKETMVGYLTCSKQFTARSCTPCPAGKYKPEETHGRCLACKTGQFQDEPGQANCKACDAATYQNQIGQTHCETDLSYFGEISSMLTITEEDELRYMQGTPCTHVQYGTAISTMIKEECLSYANDKRYDFVEDHSHKLPANCSFKNNNNVVYNEPHGVEVIFDQDKVPTDEITRTREECVEAANTNQLLLFGERTTGKVTDNNVEITSGPNTLTLNYAECKQYAENNNFDFFTDTSTAQPGGCWNYNGQKVYFNYAPVQNYISHAGKQVGASIDNTVFTTIQHCYLFAVEKNAYFFQVTGGYCYLYAYGTSSGSCSATSCWQLTHCSSTYKCIQRPVQGLSLNDCELFQKLHYPSTQYGSMFYEVSEGINKDYNQIMSEFECQQFANGVAGKTWGGSAQWSHFHSGCSEYKPNGYIYYNTQNTNLDCGVANHHCIHKYKRFQIQTNAGNPPGCFLYRPAQRVYYNFASASTASCSNDFKCVGASYNSPPMDPVYKYAIVGANDDSVAIDECKRFATMNSLSWGGDTYAAASNPIGCFRYNLELYYNQGTSTTPCSTTFLCIQKQEHQKGEPYDSSTDVPGCGVQQEIIEVSDSSLNLESLTYRECEQYASAKSIRFVGDVGIHYHYTEKTSGTGAEFCSNKGYRLAKLTDADLNLYQRCAGGLWEHYDGYEWGGYKMNSAVANCGTAGWNAFGYGYGLTSPYCAEDPNDYGPAGCFLYDHPTNGQTYYFNANFQNTKKCDATDVTHCVKRQRRYTYNTNTEATGQCTDGKVNVVKALNADEKACVKSSTNGQPIAPLPNACSNKDYVQGCLNNVQCEPIPGYTGITNLGIMNSMELCIQIAGNKGFKLATYHGTLRTCKGLIYDINEQEADNIRNRRSSSLVSATNDTENFVISIKTTDRMCGFGSAVGIANGPYQNNVLSHLADETHGAFKKCDACQQFQVQTFEEACVSCDPGKHYSSVAGGVCLDCQAGFARDKAKRALRLFYNNDTKQEDIETYDLEVMHAGIDFNTYPGTFYSQFQISYNSLSRNFRCFACVPGRFAFTDRARDCTRCPNGKYNNVWASTSNCKNCPMGQFVNDFTKNTYVDMDGSLVEDGGHFMKSSDSTPCTKCSLGFFNLNEGAAECQPCEEGTYQDVEGSFACKACAPGQFTNQKGSPMCTACPAGTYEDELGSSQCKQCEQGKYQNNEGQSECFTCIGGQYQDELQQTECKNCLPGTYTAIGQAPSYYAACSDCEAGTYQQQSKQASCFPCPKGTYGDTLKSTVIENCKSCPSGRYSNTEATNGVNGCKGCPSGTYHWDTDERKESINDCRVCPQGRFSEYDYVVVSTGNTPCQGCPKGTYNDVAGTRENHNSQTDCQYCSSGKYQDQTGQTACEKCTADGYGIGFSMRGATSLEDCDLCPQGKFSNINHFQDPIVQANCAGDSNQLQVTLENGQSCEVQYENLLCLDAQNTNFLCTNGEWRQVGSFVNDNPTCKDCPIGTYQDETGQKQCKSCGVDTQGFAGKAGAYQDQQGQKECKNTCDQVKPFQYIVDFASCRGGGGTQCSGLSVCYLLANPGFEADWRAVAAMNYPTCAGPTTSSGAQVCHNIEKLEWTDSTHRHVDFRCKVCDVGETKRVTPMLYSTRIESSSSSGSDTS